jgi:N-acetylmuramoyl-L-alanine amidase
VLIIISKSKWRWLLITLVAIVLWIGFMVSRTIYEVLTPLRGIMVMIDPGHGGVDGGCSNRGIQEKNINLQIALAIRDYLRQSGVRTGLTRDGDYPLEPFGRPGRHRRDLNRRAHLIKRSRAAIFISVHCDSSSDRSRRGPAVFYRYNNNASKRLAQLIQGELNIVAGINRRAEPGNYFILKAPPAPGALIEVGFLSNSADQLKLEEEKYRWELAAAASRGILRYLESDTNDRNVLEPEPVE